MWFATCVSVIIYCNTLVAFCKIDFYRRYLVLARFNRIKYKKRKKELKIDSILINTEKWTKKKLSTLWAHKPKFNFHFISFLVSVIVCCCTFVFFLLLFFFFFSYCPLLELIMCSVQLCTDNNNNNTKLSAIRYSKSEKNLLKSQTWNEQSKKKHLRNAYVHNWCDELYIIHSLEFVFVYSKSFIALAQFQNHFHIDRMFVQFLFQLAR